MNRSPEPSSDLTAMVADHMEKGFLDNIIDMFKDDAALYGILPALFTDERLRVRLGTTALVETLRDEDKGNIGRALPFLLPLLAHSDPNVRGDVANIVGLIGTAKDRPRLEHLLADPNPDVRTIAREALAEIDGRADA